MIRYKIDIMKTLTEHGFSRQKLRDHKIMSQATLQSITDAWRVQTLPESEIQQDPALCRRRDKGIQGITLETINKICIMCGLKVEDIVEVVPSDDEILRMYRVKNGYV